MASKDNSIAQDKDKSIEDVLQTHTALIFSIYKSMNETCNSLKNNMENLVSEFRELKTCVKESASHVQTEGEDRVKEEKDWRSHAEHLIELQEDQRKKGVDRLMLVMEVLKLSNAQNPASSTSAKLTQALMCPIPLLTINWDREWRSDLFEASSFQFSGAKHGSPASEIFQSEIKELKASLTDSASKVLTEGGDQVKEKKEEISLVEHLVQVQEDQGKEQVDRLKLVIEEPKILNEQDLTSSNAVKLTQCDVLQATVGDLLHESKSIDDVSKSVVDDNLKIQSVVPISLKLPAFGSPIISTSASKNFEELSNDRVNLPVFPSFPALDRTWNQSRFLRQMVMRKRRLALVHLLRMLKQRAAVFLTSISRVATRTLRIYATNRTHPRCWWQYKACGKLWFFAKVAEAKSGDLLNVPSSSVSTFGCGTKNFQGFPNTPVNFAASPKFSGFGSNLNQAQTSSSLFGGDRKTTTSFGSLAKEAEAKSGGFLNSTSSSMSTFGV
uniref:Uncharacterized protein n=1 Tax=Ditylenchus dipsaci TaxID=166011 RepID=A0A915DQI9_9BILA